MRPPVTYPVNLADLCSIADAACWLDGYKMHLTDQPDDYRRVTALVERLHNLVEHAAGMDGHLIYGEELT